MIYLAVIFLLALTAALIWLIVWLIDKGRVQRLRMLAFLIFLSFIPAAASLALLFLRHVVLKHY